MVGPLLATHGAHYVVVRDGGGHVAYMLGGYATAAEAEAIAAVGAAIGETTEVVTKGGV